MHLIVLIVILTVPAPSAFAQTVSIQNGGKDNASKGVEISLSRILRAKGYTVKAGSTDAFVLLLNVLQVQTRDGARTGLAGNLTIVSMQWEQLADLVFSKQCQAKHIVAQRLQDYSGTRLTQIGSTIAFAPTEDQLADLLRAFAHKTVLAASNKVDAFASEAAKINGPANESRP